MNIIFIMSMAICWPCLAHAKQPPRKVKEIPKAERYCGVHIDDNPIDSNGRFSRIITLKNGLSFNGGIIQKGIGARVNARLEWRVSDRLTIVPASVNYYYQPMREREDIKSRYVVQSGLSWKF